MAYSFRLSTINTTIELSLSLAKLSLFSVVYDLFCSLTLSYDVSEEALLFGSFVTPALAVVVVVVWTSGFVILLLVLLLLLLLVLRVFHLNAEASSIWV